MQKVIIVLFFIVITGCSSLKSGRTNIVVSSELNSKETILGKVEKNNISLDGFLIQKAEISINTEALNNKFNATIKFEKPDKYLISVRSIAGIEAARIYISGDSILINDRINRKLLYGTNRYLVSKYGIDIDLIPVFLGDLLKSSVADTNVINVRNGKTEFLYFLKGLKIRYIIDTNKNKTILLEQENNFGLKQYEVKYSGFFRMDKKLVPENIVISDLRSGNTLSIKIKKIKIPWYGNMEFIPGKSYERIELL